MLLCTVPLLATCVMFLHTTWGAILMLTTCAMFLCTNWAPYFCSQPVWHSCVLTGYCTPACNLCDVPVCYWALYFCLWLCNVLYDSSSIFLPFHPRCVCITLSLVTEAVNPYSLHKLYSVVQTLWFIYFLSAEHTSPIRASIMSGLGHCFVLLVLTGLMLSKSLATVLFQDEYS